jgi:thioredoxin 1
MNAANTQIVTQAIESNQPTVLYFSAAWCGPCRALGPKMEKMDEANPNVTFLKIDVDTERALAFEYGVMSIPLVYLITNGGSNRQKFMGGDLYKDLEPIIASMQLSN